MGTMNTRLNVGWIVRPLQKNFRGYAKKRDVKGMLACSGSEDSMNIFLVNGRWFAERGMTEEALLAAWNNQKSTLHWREHIKMFLTMCDRSKLMAAGDPLPEGETFTIYRGIGSSNYMLEGRRLGGEERGVSWTLDRDVAKFFAGAEGKILTTEVRRDEIFAYLGQPQGETKYRREQEILVLLDEQHPIRIHEIISAEETD